MLQNKENIYNFCKPVVDRTSCTSIMTEVYVDLTVPLYMLLVTDEYGALEE
jgi:hypothetical protein